MRKIGLFIFSFLFVFILAGCVEATVTWYGVNDETIEVGSSFDPMEGVSAEASMSNEPDETTSLTEFIEVYFNEVDTSTPGEYIVSYTIPSSEVPESDQEYEFYENSRTITVVAPAQAEPPVIDIDTEQPTTFNTGDDLVDFTDYFTITDAVDGTIPVSSNMLSWDPEIDMDVPGTYTLTLTVTNSLDESATESLTITVVDTLAPVITVNDSLPTRLTSGDTVPEFESYFTITDNVDGTIPVTASMLTWDAEIDMDTAGDYTLTLTVSDDAGNQATESLTFTVMTPDTDAPVIAIDDSLATTFTLGSTAPDVTSYFTALDNVDGSILITASMLSWDSEIDMNVAGDYTVTLTVSDNAGNQATESLTFTVRVPDTEPPVIAINDSLPTTFTLGDPLPDFTNYFTALDNVDGPIPITSDMLTWDVEINMNVAGDYTLTAVVSDQTLNLAVESITFTVMAPDTEAPVITVDDSLPTTFTVGDTAPDFTSYFTVVDNVDGVIPVIPSMLIWNPTTIDMTVAGTYTLNIGATDVAGNDATESITITVQASSPYSGDILLAQAIDPYIIDVIFDVDMLDNLAVDYSAFSIIVDGVPATVTDVFIGIDNISLTIDQIISINSAVTISYAKTGTDDLAYSGNLVPDFTDFFVDTTTIGSGGGSYTGSVQVAEAFDANTIDIYFDVDTLDNSVVDLSAFTVIIDGVEATITSSFVNINMVSLTISESITEFSTVDISYQPTGLNDLTYGGVLVPAFTDEPVLPPSTMPGF